MQMEAEASFSSRPFNHPRNIRDHRLGRKATVVQGINRRRRLVCQITKLEALYQQENGVDSRLLFTDESRTEHEQEHAVYSCITCASRASTVLEDSLSDALATYEIQLSKTFRARYKSAIESGTAIFRIPERFLDPETKIINIPEKEEDWSDLEPLEHRDLQQDNQQAMVQESMSGTKSVLAIRVKAPDGDAPETMDEIAAAIFGSSVDPNLIPAASVVAQYSAMSHNQLTLVAASGPGIFNGVAEITLNETVRGSPIQAELSTHILAVTAETLGPLDQIADRIIYCIPSGSLLQGRDSWTAYTYLFQHYSFFQRSRCTKLSVVVHELGHSFGFRHSGADGDDYGDETDYMGYAVNQYGMPRKAFNAHKHWLSGWFTDRSVRVDPETNGPIGAHLASFVDYSNPTLNADAVVLIRVGNLFMQFGQGKGYNVDTPTVARDRVLVVEATGPGEVSQLLTGISVGEYYSYSGYLSEYNLIIEFCEQSVAPYGSASVSIYLADGNQSSVCNNATAFGSGAGGLITQSSDGRPATGAGSLVFEDNSSEAGQKRQNVVIGVVWGFVAILVILSVYLVYRLRQEKRKKKPVTSTKPCDAEIEVQKCETDNSVASEDRVISGSC